MTEPDRRRQGSIAIIMAVFRSIWPSAAVAFAAGWLASSEIAGLGAGTAVFFALTGWQLHRFDLRHPSPRRARRQR
jgi:hypothetical protein